jgi:SAM-dependent methyltransferase
MSDWDAKYRAAPDGLFGREPNEYLRGVVARSDFAARSALCLADGDGRNSRWLALAGVETTAVDMSAVAIRNALASDEVVGATVERIVADLETWQPADGRCYGAALLIYFQGPAALRERALRIAWDALAPGGWLVVEAFAKPQMDRPGGPDSPGHLYDLAEIAAALPSHRVLEAFAGRIRLDEGRRHQGEVEVVRYLAAKP